jgi:hypothetical protein
VLATNSSAQARGSVVESSCWAPRSSGAAPATQPHAEEQPADVESAHACVTSCVLTCVSSQEEVRDLLWTNSSGPRPVVTIRELPSGVSLAGACERLVSSREEMSHVLMQGTLMRAVAATNMNNRCAWGFVIQSSAAGAMRQLPCTAAAAWQNVSLGRTQSN